MTRSEILTRIRERIVAYGTSRIGREPAEDLAQETLMLLESKYAHLDQENDLLPVAIRTMSFKISGSLRGVRRQRLTGNPVDELPISDNRPDPSEELARKQTQALLQAALAKLGARCRSLILLKLDGHRLPAICEKLGASNMQQLYTWDFRCREDLKKLMSAGGKA